MPRYAGAFVSVRSDASSLPPCLTCASRPRPSGSLIMSRSEILWRKIDTFNFTRYGLLRGRVLSVSQDAIVRDKPNEKPGTSKTGGALSNSGEPEGQECL